jgi:L-seryl-tRNA(Ser) seleniumtransferase
MTIVDRQTLYRQIPKVDQLLLRPAVAAWIVRTSHEFVVTEIQKMLQEFRDSIRLEQTDADPDFGLERMEILLSEKLQARLLPGLCSVVNATGVVLHTNLGRAPLSIAAQESLSAFSVNYTNLEYDISEGMRSYRDKLIQGLLQEVLHCEAATVVNNNAAAVFMILNTLAQGKEVIVSRGELVEIGGSFRIPDIMARSGAILREVGTTNKTRAEDYLNAITSNTALLLKVHPSNYRMHGFTENPNLEELIQVSRNSGVPLVEDIGSGCLVDLKPYGITDEPMVQESLAAGVDLICFSGDKLLGGPQAGIIAGVRKMVEPIRKNPLMRTYRVDKLVYGALQATLGSYRFGKAAEEVPVVRMIALSLQEMKKRAQSFVRRLRSKLPAGTKVYLLDGNSVIGGGSCPESLLPTKLIAIESDFVRPAAIESRLRSQNPAVIIRLEDDRALIDLRTVFPVQEPLLIDAVCKAVGSGQWAVGSRQ